jgi:hypothetical protein
MTAKNNFLAKRKLIVHYTYINDKQAPLIRLQGQWLRELGFTTGSRIEVAEQDGALLIKVAETHDVSYTSTRRNTGQKNRFECPLR